MRERYVNESQDLRVWKGSRARYNLWFLLIVLSVPKSCFFFFFSWEQHKVVIIRDFSCRAAYGEVIWLKRCYSNEPFSNWSSFKPFKLVCKCISPKKVHFLLGIFCILHGCLPGSFFHYWNSVIYFLILHTIAIKENLWKSPEGLINKETRRDWFRCWTSQVYHKWMWLF